MTDKPTRGACTTTNHAAVISLHYYAGLNLASNARTVLKSDDSTTVKRDQTIKVASDLLPNREISVRWGEVGELSFHPGALIANHFDNHQFANFISTVSPRSTTRLLKAASFTRMVVGSVRGRQN